MVTRVTDQLRLYSGIAPARTLTSYNARNIYGTGPWLGPGVDRYAVGISEQPGNYVIGLVGSDSRLELFL